jgi:hypothetical protein
MQSPPHHSRNSTHFSRQILYRQGRRWIIYHRCVMTNAHNTSTSYASYWKNSNMSFNKVILVNSTHLPIDIVWMTIESWKACSHCGIPIAYSRIITTRQELVGRSCCQSTHTVCMACNKVQSLVHCSGINTISYSQLLTQWKTAVT